MAECQKNKHLIGAVDIVYTIVCCSLWCLSAFTHTYAQTYAETQALNHRKPANFVPDDDMIIVPIVVERNFIEQFNEKHKKDFSQARRRLEYWMAQEQYAQDYGLENTGIVNLPTKEDKENFFRRNYLRFLEKDVNRSNQETLDSYVKSWTTDDEIDSIRSYEQRDEFIVKAKKHSGQKLYKAKKTIKVAGSQFKFDIQPRLEMGMVKVKMDTPFFKLRGWLGVNGRQEINIYRKFASSNTAAEVNYYLDEGRVLSIIDQRLMANWSLRLTHDKLLDDSSRQIENIDSDGQPILSENTTLQVRFGMGF